MKILIDTHVFLWGLQAEEKLSERVRRLLPVSDVWISVGSLWEIIAKVQARKLRLPRPVGEYLAKKLADNGVFVLPLTFNHVMRLEDLPLHHRDPFDRILIAQSIEDDLPLVTADKVFASYPVKVIWN
jgi:PIN domain nuclease of toxin-antitoxin system